MDNKIDRSIKVNVKDITWDTGDYEEYDDDGNILNEEEWNLPREIKGMEITLYDTDPNVPLNELCEDKIANIEETILDGLSDEYGFCVELMDWEFVKYEIVKHETKDYYYIWDLMKNEEICDEVGEPYRFDSEDEANEFIENLEDLTKQN